MEFFETLEKRHSVREFRDEEVDKETVNRLLETVNLAPSAGNLQAYRITIVKDGEVKEEIAMAAGEQECISQAPVVFVFSALEEESAASYGDRGRALYCVQDATIAAAYCQLAATDLGLGTVWVGAFDPLEVSRLIGAEAYEVPVVIIPVGHPAEEPESTSRKSLEELVREV